MALRIDLNCDMGESYGPWPMGNDAGIMQFISSANIACGFHAGDALTMRQTVRLALKHHVAIGAHPGLPDLQGFGRREMRISADEAYAMTLYQIGALQAIVRAEGGVLHHVKPHGALYNMAAKDPALAQALARATLHAGEDLILYGLCNSALTEAGAALGLRVAHEVFADRSYQSDGSLTPRSQPGAMLETADGASEQVLQIIEHQRIKSTNGDWITLRGDTVCLHGDGAHALEFATAIHTALKEKGIAIQAP